MQVRIPDISIFLFPLMVFLSVNDLSSQSEGQKYIKKDNTWYVEEKGKLYQVRTDVISVQFKAEVGKQEIESFTQKHQLRVKNVNRLGIYDFEIAKDHEIFEIINEFQKNDLVEFAEVNTIGEYIVDETPAPTTEMIIQEKRFKRKENKWYLESNGRLYEVIPNSLSLKFKKQTTPEQRQEFLDTYQLRVIRKNRLGIYDVETQTQKIALEYFADLHDHLMLEFIEVNTLGVYEFE